MSDRHGRRRVMKLIHRTTATVSHYFVTRTKTAATLMTIMASCVRQLFRRVCRNLLIFIARTIYGIRTSTASAFVQRRLV